MKTVIIYATKHGTTKKMAEAMASKLNGEVVLIDAKAAKSADIENADTVILGGSFYIGMLQKPLKNFIKNNLNALLKKRTALFFCAGAKDEKALDQELNANIPPELLQSAIFKGSAGYEMDLAKMNSIEKFMISKVGGVKESIFKLDYNVVEQLVKAVTA